MAPEVQESIEGVVEGTNKRKKNLGIDNENSPDREGKEAGERVKKTKQTQKVNSKVDKYVDHAVNQNHLDDVYRNLKNISDMTKCSKLSRQKCRIKRSIE